MNKDTRNFAAVISDFDGTLADSYPGITASVNHVRAKYHLPPLSEAEVRRHVGRGPHYLIAHTVPGGHLPDDLELYRQHYPTVMREGTRLFPGVKEALTAVKESGRSLAVCSNKLRDFTRGLLDYFGLGPLIDVVVGPEDAPRPKPAPDMLVKALAGLRVPAAAALYVGDMVVDIETARGAGVTVWVVPTGSDTRATLAAAGPDRILEGMGEIPGLLSPQR
jgi:phosphoglycolate phosphatase